MSLHFIKMVDEHKIAFNPAVELPCLKPEEQAELLDAMESEQATPSLSQAQRLKKFSQEGRLSIDVMRATMSNHHLQNRNLSLKAKGLMSLLLSLPDDWVHTLSGLAQISTEGVDAIRMAIRQLEQEGYIVRKRIRNANGQLGRMEYVVYEHPQAATVSSEPESASPTLEEPTEALKATVPMRWMQQMNSLKAQAEEIPLAEPIYC